VRFTDRIVYVTGAASGIGRAAAQRFAAEGARVFAADVNREGLDETLTLIRNAGGTADGGTCDIAVGQSVRASIDAAVRHFGGLINGAALVADGGTLA